MLDLKKEVIQSKDPALDISWEFILA